MQCRLCKERLTHVLIDLGNAPPSHIFLSNDQLNDPETFYPLKVFLCRKCFLVQVYDFLPVESIYQQQYIYYSSLSPSRVAVGAEFVDKVTEKINFSAQSQVIEIGSNDGYLLKHFKDKLIPVLGIDPNERIAKEAVNKGVDTLVEFFGTPLAIQLHDKGYIADLVIANNVLTKVSDINDFVAGAKIILKPDGILSMEFPYLVKLIRGRQFDWVSHDSLSYFSFNVIRKLMEMHGLEIFDTEELSDGYSLRVYAKHSDDISKPVESSVNELLESELNEKVESVEFYNSFQEDVLRMKVNFTGFIAELNRKNKKLAGYGASSNTNTLLNYCGIKNDVLPYVVDSNPHKQNKWLPGSRIPVVNESFLKADKPQFVLILSCNSKDEIIKELSYITDWGGQFVVPIPELRLI